MLSFIRTRPAAVLFCLLACGVTDARTVSARQSGGQSVDSRLFFTPTARPVGDGRGYVAIYELFFPFVAYGVGDRTSLAGGVSINPGSGRLLYGGAKVTVSSTTRAAFAVGGIGFLAAGDDLGGSAALLQAVGTRGGSGGAMSVGLVFGVADGEINGRPGISIGGDRRLGESIRFVSDNYIFPGVNDGLLISGGLRFVGDRLTGDFGLFTVPELLIESDGFPFLPWLGFAYSFGR